MESRISFTMRNRRLTEKLFGENSGGEYLQNAGLSNTCKPVRIKTALKKKR